MNRHWSSQKNGEAVRWSLDARQKLTIRISADDGKNWDDGFLLAEEGGASTWREQVRCTASMRKDGRTVTVFLTGGYCWHLFHWRFYDETREGRWNKQRLSLYGSVFFCILYLLCRILRIFQLYGPVFDGTRLQRHGLRNYHQPDISGKSSVEPVGGYITDTFLPTSGIFFLSE